MTTERLPLRIDSTGGSTVRTSVQNSSSSSRMRSGSTLVTDTIGVLSPRPTMPRRRDINEPAAPDQLQDRQQLCVLVPFARSASQATMPCECPAIATGGVPYRSRPCRMSARMAAIWASRMPGAEIAAVISCLVGGSGSSAASARTHCMRFEADGPHDDQLAGHGLEQQCGLTDDLAQLGFDACRADELLEVLQPGAALAAECHGVGLTGVQPIDERVRGGMASPRA